MKQTIDTKKPIKIGDVYWVLFKTMLGFTQPEITLIRVNVDYPPGSLYFEDKEVANKVFNALPQRLAIFDRTCLMEIPNIEALKEINKSLLANFRPTTLQVGLNVVVTLATSVKPLKLLYNQLFNLTQI
jgi:hypothetical protein